MKFTYFLRVAPILLCFILVGCMERNNTTLNSNSSDSANIIIEPNSNSKHNSNDELRSNGNSASSDQSLNKQSSANHAPARPLAINNRDRVVLDLPLIKQNPELKYGCEVTSLAMVLKHEGFKADKMKLAEQLVKDSDTIKKTQSGDITHWGDPADGYVGDITGKNAGYAVYAEPLERLMKKYLNDRTVNLTDKPFDEILLQVKRGKPVIVWTTGDFKVPDRWESWKHGQEKITTPLDLHVVVLVGFDRDHVYLNDPLSGVKKLKTNKDDFIRSWEILGKQALSYD